LGHTIVDIKARSRAEFGNDKVNRWEDSESWPNDKVDGTVADSQSRVAAKVQQRPHRAVEFAIDVAGRSVRNPIGLKGQRIDQEQNKRAAPFGAIPAEQYGDDPWPRQRRGTVES
jgi:hypothetical protein